MVAVGASLGSRNTAVEVVLAWSALGVGLQPLEAGHGLAEVRVLGGHVVAEGGPGVEFGPAIVAGEGGKISRIAVVEHGFRLVGHHAGGGGGQVVGFVLIGDAGHHLQPQ